MSRALLILVLPIALLAVSRSADACSCVPMSSCQRYAASPAVFVADVVEVAQGSTGLKKVRMRVIRSYKGAAKAGDDVVVSMPRGTSASCSLDADPGDRYVIHAGASADGFSTSLCQSSYGLKKADPLPDLPPPGGQVTGVLNRYQRAAPQGQEWMPIVDALVYVVTPDGRIEARTNAQGRFTMVGVPLGRRLVRSDVAPGERVEAPIDLQFKEDCAEVFGVPSPTGRLIGAVLDHTGKPVPGADVSVVPIASPRVHG